MLDHRSHWGVELIAEKVPAALRPYPRFVTWAAAFTKPGKVDKHPRQAKKPRVSAETIKPWHWATFDEACLAVEQNGFLCGLGYVLTQCDVPNLPGLFAIDLDHCIDERGVVSPQAQAIVDTFRMTYWERSPSGHGLRAFAIGELFEDVVNHAAGVELYDGRTARYVTITGQHLEGTGLDIAAVDPFALENLVETYGSGLDTSKTVYAEMPEIAAHADAEQLAIRACEALPERLVAFLRDGEVDGYPSRSECVFAVAVALYGAGWDDAEVFGALHGSPHSWQVALDHRQQKERKAFAYLWRDCCRARGSVAPGAEAFDVLDEEPATTIATKSSLVAGEGEPSSPEFSPAVWGSTTGAPRQWIVEGYLPRGEVTLFMGDGGTGKSLLMQQLQTCMALSMSWLGKPTTPGTSLALYCEDGVEELHRRQDAINAHLFVAHPELERMLIWPRPSTQGSLLMTFDNRDQGTRTKFYGLLVQRLQIRKPDLLILDTLADFYGGSEISRSQVTQFCRLLTSLAQRFNMAVLLCGHPSQSGMSSGSGMSGSTAWNNAVRSRLFLAREKAEGGIEPNPNVRTLSRMKANYAGAGDKLRLCWVDGVFRHEHEPQADTFFATADQEATEIFLELLAEFERTERRVSTSKRGNYAPRVFAERMAVSEDQKRSWTVRFEQAMQQLIKDCRIEECVANQGRTAALATVTKK